MAVCDAIGVAVGDTVRVTVGDAIGVAVARAVKLVRRVSLPVGHRCAVAERSGMPILQPRAVRRAVGHAVGACGGRGRRGGLGAEEAPALLALRARTSAQRTTLYAGRGLRAKHLSALPSSACLRSGPAGHRPGRLPCCSIRGHARMRARQPDSPTDQSAVWYGVLRGGGARAPGTRAPAWRASRPPRSQSRRPRTPPRTWRGWPPPRPAPS